MKLLDRILENRNGQYCHALELNNYHSFECIIESIIQDNEDLDKQDFIEFFNTIELYYLPVEEENKEEEEELYNFSSTQFINEILD